MGLKAKWTVETKADGAWTREGLGDLDANVFETKRQAEQAVTQFKGLGPDWAAAEYRVREIAVGKPVKRR